MGTHKFQASDWVEILSAREIAATLDTNGTLDGLPFMPEMLPFCGGRFRVAKLASKTCVEYASLAYQIRTFPNDDVVILETPRCSGEWHGGCQRSCTLFWKTAWLRPAAHQSLHQTAEPAQVGAGAPLDLSQSSLPPGWPGTLQTRRDADRYVCQSTELIRSTVPLARWVSFKKCFSDVATGSRGLLEMARLVVNPVGRKIFARFLRNYPEGKLTKTPTGNLNLQPGELVQIKSEAEIAETLDRRGRNRGMVCDTGMTRSCGETFKVRTRLDRMICEPDGRMREIEATVILEGSSCLCWNVVGGCPRGDFAYWREVWLNRVAVPQNQTESEPDRVSSTNKKEKELARR